MPAISSLDVSTYDSTGERWCELWLQFVTRAEKSNDDLDKFIAAETESLQRAAKERPEKEHLEMVAASNGQSTCATAAANDTGHFKKFTKVMGELLGVSCLRPSTGPRAHPSTS